MRQLRPGTTRLREDLEALSQRPVAEVTGPSTRSEIASDSSGADRRAGAGNADVLIGTEAVLHRSGRADTVVFLDIDGELLAPRMRSADAVVALVVRAARLVGTTGRVVLVTRQAESPVLRALALADGESLSAELCRSLNALSYGPPAAVAVVSGAGAAAVGASLAASIDRPGSSIARIGPVVGPFVLIAPTIDQLSDALAAVERPAERVRVEVDPVRW